ncbi:MAG: protein-export chaperone SecB [Hyphomicrobiaceae bacterium]|nr:protein-export chaperone SecB [Hyphomicrobiaceae bacterium]
MTDTTNGQTPQPAPVQAQIVAQYIKDLSFENPNIEKLLSGPGENPNMRLEVNVNGRRMGPDLFESAIDFSAKATSQAGTIYELELVYAGMFRLQNLPEEAVEPFLLINCPTLLFPFLRRIVADISREGGFPPLLLDPIDFAGLFMRRKQEAAAVAGTA